MIRASSILFWTVLTIATSVGLYHTSYRVHELNKRMHELNVAIETEQRNIHVLKAEWVYLTNPAKIEQAARKYLSLHPAALQQIANLDRLKNVLSSRTEAVADVAVSNTPIASVVPPAPVAIAQKPRRLASAKDSTHVNTHMVIQRSVASAPLSAHGPLVLANFGTRP